MLISGVPGVNHDLLHAILKFRSMEDRRHSTSAGARRRRSQSRSRPRRGPVRLPESSSVSIVPPTEVTSGSDDGQELTRMG